jgi:hypothetical protein
MEKAMRYDVEVRSLVDGGWARRCYIVDAETGDEAAACAKTRAARALPRASVHLSYTVRPAEKPDIAAPRKAKPVCSTPKKKSRVA